jgi:hypothetical protein
VETFRQQRQEDAVGIALDQGSFVSGIRGGIYRLHTEDMPFRLQGAAQLLGPVARPPCDDDPLDGRVSEHLFDVRDRFAGRIPAAEILSPRSRPRIDRQFVSARLNQGPSHVEAVRMISKECETHEFEILCLGSFIQSRAMNHCT